MTRQQGLNFGGARPYAAKRSRRVTGLVAASSATLSSLCVSSGRDRATQPNLCPTGKTCWVPVSA